VGRVGYPTLTTSWGRAPRARAGRKLRCVGSYLSPNGLAFCEGGQVSLALMDRVLAVDAGRRQVTVQAGARVQEVRATARAAIG